MPQISEQPNRLRHLSKVSATMPEGAELADEQGNLSETGISLANFAQADLIMAQFIGACLWRADLSRADLSRANLSGLICVALIFVGRD